MGCSGGATQKFASTLSVGPWNPTNNQIRTMVELSGAFTGHCSNIKGGSSADQTRVITWSCGNDNNMIWFRDGDSRLHTRLDTNKCLDAGEFTHGAEVRIHTCHDGECS